MDKIQVYLPEDELEELRAAAKHSGRSVADLVRDAVRKTVLKPKPQGFVNIWNGKPKRTAMEHDTAFDEP
jgi:hypothetical protein